MPTNTRPYTSLDVALVKFVKKSGEQQMTSDTVKRRLKELDDLVQSSQNELKQIRLLLEIFPDLEIKTDRWKNRRFSASTANSKVEDFYTAHSCGCCSDSPLFAYPYLEINGARVHSEPERFYIGERCSYTASGELYDSDCIEKLEECQIAKPIIDRIEKLVSQEPEYVEDDDDDDY